MDLMYSSYSTGHCVNNMPEPLLLHFFLVDIGCTLQNATNTNPLHPMDPAVCAVHAVYVVYVAYVAMRNVFGKGEWNIRQKDSVLVRDMHLLHLDTV